MRLWSVHPRHLDRQGLTAVWREALLAQAVLAGRTRGYRHHPQLERFQACGDPRGAIAFYLDGVRDEASSRGYRYDAARVDDVPRFGGPIAVTDGQLALEWAHLRAKLAARSPGLVAAHEAGSATVHPLFTVVSGPVEPWERAVVPGVT